ncbi:MAG TPA: ATP-binding protein, partial [Bdellovibrio sp.]|nr:ATP-binding protein [Bdellovibrio sp.]
MKDLARNIGPQILKDLSKKIVLIAGPRQCGKTTLSKSLKKNYDYFNYDNFDDRSDILARKWERKKDLIIFDELHKMPKWKSWLKGIYDKEGLNPALLVTGSARLNTFKKTGDSLAGRHFYFRLHPFDMKELTSAKLHMSHNEMFSRLMTVSGYPEPFLNGEIDDYRRWRQGHLDIILKQDLSDLESVKDIKSMEILVQLLRTKVGSGISANALANDLQKDPKTVQRWLGILEDLFVIFKVTPYAKDIARTVKKEPKYYFYDTGFVQGEDAQKLENLIACALLKESHFLMDVKGQPYNLHFLKIKGGREIDFVLVPEEKHAKATMIEVKWSDDEVSPNFKLFQGAFKNC